MYTNQPYQQYPPVVVNNQYADNPRLVKSTFARPSVIGMIVSLGIMLAVMVYSLISTISGGASITNGLSSSYYTSRAASVTQMVIVWTVIIQIIVMAVYFLPFIGLIIMYSKSRNTSDFSSPKAGITLNFTFAIIFTVISSIMTLIMCFFASTIIAALPSAIIGSHNNYYSSSLDQLATNILNMMYLITFLMIAYCVVMVIWSSSAIALCSSMKKTLKGEGLFTGGATPLCVCSILSMGIVVALFVIVLIMINSIPGSQYVTGNSSVISATVTYNIPSLISALAMFMFNIFLIVFATSYKKIIKNASIGQSASSSAAYYQSTYQGVSDNNSNPPYNVQDSQTAFTYYSKPQQNINNNPQPTSDSNAQLNLNKPVQPTNVVAQTQNDGIICPVCSTKNKVGNMFCQDCGNNLKTVKASRPNTESDKQLNLNKTPQPNDINTQAQGAEVTCPACGTKNKVSNMFCQGCGNNLKTVKAPQPNVNTESNTQLNLNKPVQPTNVVAQTQSDGIICPVCSTKNKVSNMFCQSCGNNLKAVTPPQPDSTINLDKPPVQITENICSACGTKNKPDSLFCQNCGTKLK